jgi:hypothetical protein
MNKREYDVLVGDAIPETLSESLLRLVTLEISTGSGYADNVRLITLAGKIEIINPEMWRSNHWLRAVAGSNPEHTDFEWRCYLLKEMVSEMKEIPESEFKQ